MKTSIPIQRRHHVAVWVIRMEGPIQDPEILGVAVLIRDTPGNCKCENYSFESCLFAKGDSPEQRAEATLLSYATEEFAVKDCGGVMQTVCSGIQGGEVVEIRVDSSEPAIVREKLRLYQHIFTF